MSRLEIKVISERKRKSDWLGYRRDMDGKIYQVALIKTDQSGRRTSQTVNITEAELIVLDQATRAA